jgi:hypothetical protein
VFVILVQQIRSLRFAFAAVLVIVTWAFESSWDIFQRNSLHSYSEIKKRKNPCLLTNRNLLQMWLTIWLCTDFINQSLGAGLSRNYFTLSIKHM